MRAADIFKGFGAITDVEHCRELLREIEKGLRTLVASDNSGFNI